MVAVHYFPVKSVVRNLEGFQFRWLKITEIFSAFSILIKAPKDVDVLAVQDHSRLEFQALVPVANVRVFVHGPRGWWAKF